MLVYVNDTPVTIFSGAVAMDAVRRYCTDTRTPLPASELYDAWGNVIAADSPMSEQRRIYTALPS